MRILHVISSVDPAYGGPIEGIKQFARAHIRNGHQVEICSLDDPCADWVSNCELPVHAVGPSYTHYWYASALLGWLRAHVHHFDAVIVNGIWQYHAHAVWRAARELHFQYFVFPHGMLDPYFKHRYPAKHLKKWLVWPWSEYRVLRDAEAVLFTSETERQLARESFWLYRARERVVGYGISPPHLHPGQIEAFHEAFPDLRGQRFLLFLGRIHPKKGCDLLIEGFARTTRRDPALQLVMAGPDATHWRSALEARATELGVASRIRWVGMVSGDLKWGGPVGLRSLNPAFAPGKLRHRGGGGDGLRQAGADLHRSQYLARDRGRRRRTGRARHGRRDCLTDRALDGAVHVRTPVPRRARARLLRAAIHGRRGSGTPSRAARRFQPGRRAMIVAEPYSRLHHELADWPRVA
jgi:glycosyltransferase involved in cell wall biosynthesis